jgi:hypothetical protein
MQLFREGGSRFEQAFGSEEGVALIMDQISPNPMSLEETYLGKSSSHNLHTTARARSAPACE